MFKRKYLGKLVTKKQFINKRLAYLKKDLKRGYSPNIKFTYTLSELRKDWHCLTKDDLPTSKPSAKATFGSVDAENEARSNALPTHIPFFFTFAQQGPSDHQMVGGEVTFHVFQ